MMLAAGMRLGHYEIVAKLGAGGMGEIWRAVDSRLGREVALKVLPPGLGDNPERHARFEREAKLLASLSHPHVATLHALEHLEGQHVLVMELVEGEDLAARIGRGALPVAEAIVIARQIAEALEAAHERGIVHRDLKPANVKVRPDGTVKVLDFGLAKALDAGAAANPSLSPTITHAATEAGLILGTAAYMAPEQARGGAVDTRADVWAFGAVLYEMLAGRQLFAASTVSDTLAAVLRDEVDWAALPAATPDAVRRLLERCLDRDVKHRLQAIGEARVALEEATAGPRSEPARARGRAAGSRVPHLLPWPVVAAVVIVGVAALVLWQRSRTAPEAPARGAGAGRSIAVLPFVNSSGSAEDEYLADGMTDELIAGLGKVPQLHVAARSSVFTFKGQKTDAREAARRLGVDSVLEGTVRRSGRRLRVTASLVSAADGLQLWSSSFDNDGGDAFAVQDEVTRGVVSGLSLQLRGAALAASQAGRTRDPEALDLYLRGLASANAASEADLRRALDLYQQALARDPDFALAYTGIAWVHEFLADAYVVPIEAYTKAKAAAQAALARDDRVADAHALLGYATFALEWGSDAAVDREFSRALELDPNSVNSLFLRAGSRCFTGRADEAFDEVERAERLDPLSPLVPTLREICNYSAQRWGAVIEAHRSTVALDPSFGYLQSWAGAAYRELGDYPAALREYAAAPAPGPQFGLALTYVRMGREQDARDILRNMEERARTQYVPYVMRAEVHAALGNMDTAVALLQQAVDHREGLLLLTRSLPEAAPFARDPRGRRILDQVDAMRKAP